MAKRRSALEIMVEVFSGLPSWVCLGLAGGAWFGLGALAKGYSAPPAPSTDLAQTLVQPIMAMLLRYAQYGVPAILALSAILGACARFSRARKLAAATANPQVAIEALSWRQFEQLLADAFRRQGFSVLESGGSRPDGGVDLRLRRDGQVHLVQAKHWKTRSVGVKVVRELYGVMTAETAAAALVVTSGDFTAEALVFARGKPLTLVDGEALAALLRGAHAPVVAPVVDATPTCPRCGGGMVRREARRGTKAGSAFWGCSGYPRCRGIVDLYE